MDITSILVEAQKAVDDAKISDDLRSIAFGKAVEALSQRIGEPQAGAAPVRRSSVSAAHTGESGTEKIGGRLGLAAEVIGEIYSDNEAGGADVVLGVGKLDNSTATATKQIALLVAAARQLTGGEEWTDSREIRRVCSDYGRFDTTNFAKTIKRMDDAFSFRGKGQQIQVRLHQRGVDKLKQLITSVTGG